MIGIVAHTQRAQQAHTLMTTVGAAYMSIDDGTLGGKANHIRVWQWLAQHSTDTYSVVLEDDAIPCERFREQATLALAKAPTDVVSLYLGTGHPRSPQPAIAKAIQWAQHSPACWITAHELHHAVGTAIRTDLITDMLTYITPLNRPIDQAVTSWATRKHHPRSIAYTAPSLIDHEDGDTVVTTRRRIQSKPRKAWWVGTRDTWTTDSIPL